MDVRKKDIKITWIGKSVMVNLKWLRGAGRYNNGGTVHHNVKRIRLICNNLKDIKMKKLMDQL